MLLLQKQARPDLLLGGPRDRSSTTSISRLRIFLSTSPDGYRPSTLEAGRRSGLEVYGSASSPCRRALQVGAPSYSGACGHLGHQRLNYFERPASTVREVYVWLRGLCEGSGVASGGLNLPPSLSPLSPLVGIRLSYDSGAWMGWEYS